MTRFVQLHLITSYPPANLNRDDLGRPKTAVMGGEMRLRISSQSLKRAWRTSDLFKSALGGHVGTRTKEMGKQIAETLITKGIGEKKAVEWSQQIAKRFGKLTEEKNKHPAEIQQLAHFSPEERAAIDDLVEAIAERGSAPTDEELNLLREGHTAADIALFGRMLAAAPRYNTEAAAQVAHAISVHKVALEDDFFTAVDDLNQGLEDVGAGHMGETEFAAGLFYLYLCIDRELLRENLGGDQALADQALTALLESAATVAPTGKQNSFASRARASFILAEKGDQQPRSLSVAFLSPVTGRRKHPETGKPFDSMLDEAIFLLRKTRADMEAVYGPCAEGKPAVLNATDPADSCSLGQLKTYVTE
ncbi:MAG: type I-E CRISPR-associated protein Cas7/Cse4/CasC [Chromatiaceae bacterium]|nr:type I-E CRISPR-associated protein Cas7/Cse4/CasC [Chromatiaceae bacterium]